jgi:dihydrofolate reductase
MGRLIMWNLVSLDGLFEGPNQWDLGFHELVWGDELEQLSLQQLRSAGMLLFGRVTYEGMAAYWPNAEGENAEVARMMNRVPKAVFSRTLDRADWANTTLVKDPPEDYVARLKQEEGGDLYVFGSADLSDTLIRHRLFDEYRLCLAPVVLGQGTPLFKAASESRPLKLTEARPLKSGGLILRYEPAAR